jgi:hypothetical protein
MTKYKISSVKTKKGESHRLADKLIGEVVEISNVQLSAPLFAQFLDYEDRILRTSSVEAYNADWETSNILVIQTKNSIYTFHKVKDEA